MDDRFVIRLVCQFLDELGLQDTLRSLERERQERDYDECFFLGGNVPECGSVMTPVHQRASIVAALAHT